MADGAPDGTAATVRVLLFSVLRERVGTDELRLARPDPPTGAALLDGIEAAHPAFAPFRSVVRLAVNQAYVQPDAVLHAGDEVALISPVSGG